MSANCAVARLRAAESCERGRLGCLRPPRLDSRRTIFPARFRRKRVSLACHVPDRAPFSLQTPVERSERLAGGWAVRARANPLSLGVWPFTLRFVLPTGVGLATLAEGRKAVACSRHLDPKSTQSLRRHARGNKHPARCAVCALFLHANRRSVRSGPVLTLP